MGLNKDTKRRLRSVTHLILTDKMDKTDFKNLIEKSKGKDFELTTILMRANSKAIERYEAFTKSKAISSLSVGISEIPREDRWISEDYLKKTDQNFHDDKEFMQKFLSPEIQTTEFERNKELKAILKNFSKKDRVIALGLDSEPLEKGYGIYR